MYQAVLMDMGGVLYQGRDAIPGAREALARLRASDLTLRFVTNTSRKSRDQVLDMLSGLGFDIQAQELFTAPLAAASYLQSENLSPLLLVADSVREDFPASREPFDAVVLADGPEHLDYAHLDHAFRLLVDGAPLLAIGDNRYFAEKDGLHLDVGPFVRALEYAAGVEAIITGKPSPTFFERVLADAGCEPGQAVMIGDDVAADVVAAMEAGMDGLLVRTGKYRAGDETAGGKQVPVVDDLSEAVERILAGNGQS